MLMGRRTYEYFAPAWPKATGPNADRVNAIPKHVLSRTLESVDWTGAPLSLTLTGAQQRPNGVVSLRYTR
jgi:dihydrofolate reductase